METFNMLLMLLIVLFSGLFLFYLALHIAETGMKKKIALSSMFKEFRQKMWMTSGLGLVFFCLYLLSLVLGSSFNDPQLRLDFFFLVYENPVTFVYLGLLTFACFSAGIYLVRLVIKHFYNTRKY